MGRNSTPGDRRRPAPDRVKPALRLVRADEAAGSPFDDLDALRQALPPVATRRARSSEFFARIPIEKGLALYRHHIGDAGWAILIELDRLILKRGCNPVRLASHNLAKYGISRHAKRRALRSLREAGVISFEQRGNEAPLVLHHWFPARKVCRG